MRRLVILTGPSCVGKSPLLRALQKFYPELAARLQPLVLFNDRVPRPGEVDGVAYHFRTRADLEALQGRPGYLVLPVRRDLQGLELAQIQRVLASGLDPLFEGNVYFASRLLQAPELSDLPKVSCYLSPLSREELEFLQREAPGSVERIVCEIMRRKLLHRTQRQKGLLSEDDLRDIEARCGAAFEDLKSAALFDWVLPNHDGEGSDNWEAFYYPLGDARRCLQDFAAILQGEDPRWAERWG